MYCITEPMGVALNRYTRSGSSWMYFLVSNEPDSSGETIQNVPGLSEERLRQEDFWILSLCRSWKSLAHTWQILESFGKLPSEEGMKSDGEHGKSGEWVETTSAAATLCLVGQQFDVSFHPAHVLQWKGEGGRRSSSGSFWTKDTAYLLRFLEERHVHVLVNR